MKIFVFLLLVSNAIFPQWNLQYSQSGDILNCVYFVDYNNGWAVGGRLFVGALILKTTNGGINWSDNLTIPGTVNLFNSVHFIDVNNGWVVGGGGVIMQTTNSGVTWDTVVTSTNAYLHQIQFIDPNYGWITGTEDNLTGGVIQKTSDGGINWEQIDLGSESILISTYFLNQNLGWGTGNQIKKTTDGGYNWVTMNDSLGGGGIYSSDEFHIWAVGASDTGPNGYINRTTDGGSTWFRIAGLDIPQLRSVKFYDNNIGWAVGWGTSTPIIKTTDGGANWFHQESGSVTALNSVFIIDSVTGWAVGNGAILNTTNGGVTFVEQKEIDETPTAYYLNQNYPNPFNPSTVIEYRIQQSGLTSLKVYDVLGNKVATLVDEYKPAGTYEVEFNISSISGSVSAKGGYASGVYFYQLRFDSFVDTKKMILMK